MTRIYGYARCSTNHQQVDSQIQQLMDAGATKVFSEKVSSRTPAEQRPQLQAVLTVLEEGDSLYLTRLDRCGRTQNEVVNILHDLHTKGIFVKTLDGLIDTKSLGKNTRNLYKNKKGQTNKIKILPIKKTVPLYIALHFV